jgi:formate dehydrogenase subunit gamma
MKTSVIPDHPVPLTGEQAEAMEQHLLKKHHIAIILLHWSNAMVWAMELLTGAALISSPHFRILPEVFIRTVEELFGSRANLLRVHLGIGLTWIFVFLAYGIFGFRTYLAQEVLKKEIGMDKDDFAWLRIRILGILGRSKEKLPPQGVYNAGQKLFAVMVYAMLPVIMATGVIMAFHLFGTAVVGWAALIHFCAVGAVVSGLIVHVYMGAIFPEEKPAFFSMITGSVNERFAYSHHFKWWREMKLEELAWEKAQDEAVQQAENQKAEPAPSQATGSGQS